MFAIGFKDKALIKVDNQRRGSAVIIVNPVPFDGCPWRGKTVLRAQRPVITSGNVFEVRSRIYAQFPIHATPSAPGDSQIPLREPAIHAIVVVSIVLRDDLNFPWIWLSLCYLRKSFPLCNNTRNGGAISEVIGAMARRKVVGNLWRCLDVGRIENDTYCFSLLTYIYFEWYINYFVICFKCVIYTYQWLVYLHIIINENLVLILIRMLS